MTRNIALKNKRNETGLTQWEVAEKANVSERTMVSYESGERTPKVRTAIRIARALGVNDFTTFKKLFSEPA